MFFKIFGFFFLLRFILSLCFGYFIFEPLLFIWSSFVFATVTGFVVWLGFHLFRDRFIFVLPIAWFLGEVAWVQYSIVPTYIGMVGNFLANSPFLGLSKFGGIYGLSFFAVTTLGFLFWSIALYKNKKLCSIFLLSFLVVVALGWVVSERVIKLNSFEYKNLPEKISVLSVSVGTEHDAVLNSIIERADINESERERFVTIEAKNLLSPVLKRAREIKPDIIFLPDDFLANQKIGGLGENLEAKEKFGILEGGVILSAYQEFALEVESNVLVNVRTVRKGGIYNSIIHFARDGSIVSVYDKNRLLLGSEYWPVSMRPFYLYDSLGGSGEFLKFFKLLLPIFDEQTAIVRRINYQKGDPMYMELGDFKFITPICNEGHYPGVTKIAKDFSAKAILNATGNRWIRIGLETYTRLFLNLRRIYAVQGNIPFVVNGRPDFTGIILPDGEFRGSSPDGGITMELVEVKY